jgi:hypothetical protein
VAQDLLLFNKFNYTVIVKRIEEETEEGISTPEFACEKRTFNEGSFL